MTWTRLSVGWSLIVFNFSNGLGTLPFHAPIGAREFPLKDVIVVIGNITSQRTLMPVCGLAGWSVCRSFLKGQRSYTSMFLLEQFNYAKTVIVYFIIQICDIHIHIRMIYMMPLVLLLFSHIVCILAHPETFHGCSWMQLSTKDKHCG